MKIAAYDFRRKGSGATILLVLAFLGLVSCGVGKDTRSIKINNMAELQQLVESREFEIQHQWAEPLSGSSINLIGNPNFIRFEEDSVDIFLPYFGVRHSGAGYGSSDGGISYEGSIENLDVKKVDEDKLRLKIEGEQESEDLAFLITLFPNGKANTSVTSSDRSSISYRGEIRALAEDENLE